MYPSSCACVSDMIKPINGIVGAWCGYAPVPGDHTGDTLTHPHTHQSTSTRVQLLLGWMPAAVVSWCICVMCLGRPQQHEQGFAPPPPHTVPSYIPEHACIPIAPPSMRTPQARGLNPLHLPWS
jgi:hypothetical protein